MRRPRLPQPTTPEEAKEQAEALARHPYANPTTEYCDYKGYENQEDIESDDDVSNRDLLVAILRSADCMCHELRWIRKALEDQA